ncbi:hypothetical protein ACFLV7_16480 [Chloroflexota bacterium]
MDQIDAHILQHFPESVVCLMQKLATRSNWSLTPGYQNPPRNWERSINQPNEKIQLPFHQLNMVIFQPRPIHLINRHFFQIQARSVNLGAIPNKQHFWDYEVREDQLQPALRLTYAPSLPM